MLMMFGVIESARAVWTYQVVQDTARYTARHAATSGGTCESVRQKAIAKAAGSSILMATDDISVTSGVTCHDVPGMVRVQIQKSFLTSLGKLLPGLNTDLLASSCFPNVASATFAACGTEQAEEEASPADGGAGADDDAGGGGGSDGDGDDHSGKGGGGHHDHDDDDDDDHDHDHDHGGEGDEGKDDKDKGKDKDKDKDKDEGDEDEEKGGKKGKD